MFSQGATGAIVTGVPHWDKERALWIRGQTRVEDVPRLKVSERTGVGLRICGAKNRQLVDRHGNGAAIEISN